MKPSQRITLDISWTALLKILAMAASLWLVFLLREILIMLVVVFIFVAAVNPTISRMQRYLSRTWAVSLFYLALFLILAALSYAFVPTLVQQVQELTHSLPAITAKLKPALDSIQGNHSTLITKATNSLTASLNAFSAGLVNSTLSFVGGLVTAVAGLVLSFYLLLEEKNAKDFFNQLLPPHRFKAVYTTVTKISERMGDWVSGQVGVIVIIGASNFIGYVLIGVHSPLPLAIWAGLCEVIPYVGPTLGMLPALIVALTTGNLLQAALVLIISMGVVQQFEAHIVVPKIMGRAVGLSPVLVILALLTGDKLFGLLGAVFAIPIAAIISVVVGEWPQLRKIWEEAS